MLHEAPLASSDAARLDHADADTVPDDVFLGHDLVGAPPEVRAAAVRRSRRLPEPTTMQAAWAGLPLDVRDRVGVMALTHSFYSMAMAEEHHRILTREGSKRCEAWSDVALNGIDAVLEAALPGLYGTTEDEPFWAQQDAPELPLQVGTKPEPHA